METVTVSQKYQVVIPLEARGSLKGINTGVPRDEEDLDECGGFFLLEYFAEGENADFFAPAIKDKEADRASDLHL